MDTVAPESVGLSAERLALIRPAMQGFVDARKIAGPITLIARRGKVAHFECVGAMDIEAAKPMRPDTIFRIYSMTKPITTVAVMMLVEQGKLLLSDTVARYIPAFRDVKVYTGPGNPRTEVVDLERPPTIHNLLTHTAGLGYGSFADSPVEELYRDEGFFTPLGKLAVTLDELVERVPRLPLANQPGARWRYSVATDVLGYIVGLVSGMPFDTFLRERIFEPLGMNDTGFYVPAEKVERFAACYMPVKTNPLAAVLPSALATVPGDNLLLVDAPATSPFLQPNLPPAGGTGLVSTAADYLQFAQMLLNGGELDGVRLISRKTVELMSANHLPLELLPLKVGDFDAWPGFGFGLGVKVRIGDEGGLLGSPGMYGWMGIADTEVRIDPVENVIILYMPQIMWTRDQISSVVQNLTYQAISD